MPRSRAREKKRTREIVSTRDKEETQKRKRKTKERVIVSCLLKFISSLNHIVDKLSIPSFLNKRVVDFRK